MGFFKKTNRVKFTQLAVKILTIPAKAKSQGNAKAGKFQHFNLNRFYEKN